MKKIITPTLLLAVIFVFSGCSFYKKPSVPSNNQSQNQSAAQNQNSSLVNIQNFAFNPSELTVKKGTTVIWKNNDSAKHQIKSDTFNSAPLNQGDTFSFTFNEAGAFDYSCAIHPSMQGKIIVQ